MLTSRLQGRSCRDKESAQQMERGQRKRANEISFLTTAKEEKSVVVFSRKRKEGKDALSMPTKSVVFPGSCTGILE
jgi:hypothetical protein